VLASLPHMTQRSPNNSLAMVRSDNTTFRAKRRALFFGVLVCVMVSLLFITSCSASETPQEEVAEAPTDRPNIVFILTDDLDFASASKTPQIRSRLIEEGTSFEKAFVSLALCCPSRATILTGLYAHNHDVTHNEAPAGGFQKFVDEGHEENTIAVRLQEGGYQTAFFGKYLNDYPGDEESTYIPPGWDEWYGKHGHREHQPYRYKINENGQVVSYGNNTEDYYSDVLSRQATDYVGRTAEDSRPFFMFVAPTAPHGPATPAERHKGAFASEEGPRPPSFDEEDVSDKPTYVSSLDRISEEEASAIDEYYRERLESMLAVDEMVASLIQELEAAGKLDNTYIFFTSDNGWEQGEHRMRKGKVRPYEESVRVPLFVRGPGAAPGSTIEKLTLNTDFAPTIAELAGIEFLTDGRSLAPLLRGEDPPWRSVVLLEKFGGGEYKGVRTETHKYVEYSDGPKELYDLEADPYELDSLHESADPSLLGDLKTKLDVLKNCSNKGCQEAEDVP
jgi:N-acetylglucosamine-6-sulfatase